MAACAGLASCSGQQAAQAPPAPDPAASLPQAQPDDQNRIRINADGSTMTWRKDGATTLVARTQASSTELNREDAGDLTGDLKQVSGELFQKGKIASRFQAPEGRFDQNAKSMQLQGGVTITSEERRLVLTASRVRWTEGGGLIRAEGQVWLRGPQFESGPAPVLVATPDLARIGTPDRIKS